MLLPPINNLRHQVIFPGCGARFFIFKIFAGWGGDEGVQTFREYLLNGVLQDFEMDQGGGCSDPLNFFMDLLMGCLQVHIFSLKD